LTVIASTIALKKNEMIACIVTRRRKRFDLIATSEVCEAAPIEVAK
jgi:hypothetical protein